MIQITKITVAFALIISLASCQSSKNGCYDFGEVNTKVSKMDKLDTKRDLIFTNVVCKP